MPIKDLHAKPFDDGTITKLEIFENYAKEWIPTFVMSDYYREVWIFDFFAGTGYDIKGVAGSPIRILKQIKGQVGNIFKTQTKVNICFNELDKDKFNSLKQSCIDFIINDAELERLQKNNFLKINYKNEDVAKLFPISLQTIKQYPSLVYLDQNGIKFLSNSYFLALAETKETDFLYFLSSSYINHYGKTVAFKSTINIDVDRARQNPYKYFHRNVLEQVREWLPKDSKCVLYPFTIKKGANIYGIIFGASHPLAVNKFLTTAWNQNSINGEANFDIDDDEQKLQPLLFEDMKLLTKKESFKQKLIEKILNGNLKNNKDVFDFTLQQGHIAEHAAEAVKELKKKGKILYDEKSPLINYDNVYKKKKIIEYNVVIK
ncbi:MAG: three-Cys-motif partner protein TcmP [Bacteroidales bacterium]|nr:three-Cys-motif partner protein TcmP [Bacteroidales bacterium]